MCIVMITLLAGRKADQVKYAEAFEICEYGSYPNYANIRLLLPMLRESH